MLARRGAILLDGVALVAAVLVARRVGVLRGARVHRASGPAPAPLREGGRLASLARRVDGPAGLPAGRLVGPGPGAHQGRGGGRAEPGFATVPRWIADG